jgi:Tol biopolymer transport system component
MPTDQRDRITDLYHRALARAPEERAAFIEAASEGDDGLKREVESLLAFEAGTTNFLERPAVAGLASAMRPDLLGRQLGPYAIVGLLGSGGMSEVYRAHDGRLGRDVAIKILPSHFTIDPERRLRFVREARVLAALNHPHIGAIYGLEEAEGSSALVLELIEGPTLAERLQRGAVPMVDALAIARQIAEALGAAHDKGIVHRDLKPANVVLQGGGAEPSAGPVRCKVLDFGLAKMLAGPQDHDPAGPLSLASDATIDGRILGTPAYMSPEQARGEGVDRRTDIWAFGCVLFEMLAGSRAFGGGTAAETLASVLEREPDWSLLPGHTSPGIRRLLQRCLRKSPDRRLHDIADARLELEETDASAAPGRAVIAAVLRPRARRWAGWIAAALAVTAGWLALSARRDVEPSVERLEFALAPPPDSRFFGTSPEFAIAPDARSVAFVAYSASGWSLWVQSLATLELRELAGTHGARNPFWSPDSSSIGFFAEDQLKTVQVTGGSPVSLCPAPGTEAGSIPHSGAWNREDTILFALHDGLRQVRATGGPAAPVAGVPGETSPAWPTFLPDGQHFLYLACCRQTPELFVGSITTGESRSLGAFESNAQYAADHLFFVRGGNLMAQPFDVRTRRLTGEPLHLGIQAGVNPAWDRGTFSVSSTGRVVYRPAARTLKQLTWFDRGGVVAGTLGHPGVFSDLDLGPGGRMLAVSEMTQQTGSRAQFDIWLWDLATGRTTRLTDDPAWEFTPSWSPDGTSVAFMSNRPPTALRFGLFVRPSDGSGDDVKLVEAPTAAPDWGPHGVLVYHTISAGHGNPALETAADLWTIDMNGARRPAIYLQTKHDETNAAFSPDGRWIAYQSGASGRDEVYVRRFPSRPPSYRVSRDGGATPAWRGDGRELFFLAPDGAIMAAPVDARGGFSAGVPQALFGTTIRGGRHFGVTSDGQRFLVPVESSQPLRVVLDWRALLPR